MKIPVSMASWYWGPWINIDCDRQKPNETFLWYVDSSFHKITPYGLVSEPFSQEFKMSWNVKRSTILSTKNENVIVFDMKQHDDMEIQFYTDKWPRVYWVQVLDVTI